MGSGPSVQREGSERRWDSWRLIGLQTQPPPFPVFLVQVSCNVLCNPIGDIYFAFFFFWPTEHIFSFSSLISF